MLHVAGEQQLQSGIRTLAMELLMTLCEAREKAPPGMMRKLPDFVPTVFTTIMTWLLDIEDDEEWHTADKDDG